MATFELEQQAWNKSLEFYGIDEAAYGCGAGSMFIAVVSFDKNFTAPELKKIKDSKKLSHEQRAELAPWIKANAKYWKIFEVDVQRINDGSPYYLRFSDAEEWSNTVDAAVICFDGNVRLQNSKHEMTCCVKGDSVSLSIAAASILAKNAKDEEMAKLDILYPQYGFIGHSGYVNIDHVAAVKKHGFTDIHRKSYFTKQLAK